MSLTTKEDRMLRRLAAVERRKLALRKRRLLRVVKQATRLMNENDVGDLEERCAIVLGRVAIRHG